MKHFIHTNKMNEEIQELNILIKTLPVSTAERERRFSFVNIICSDLRSKLTIKNMANLIFININGPSFSVWNPTKYVEAGCCTKDRPMITDQGKRSH